MVINGKQYKTTVRDMNKKIIENQLWPVARIINQDNSALPKSKGSSFRCSAFAFNKRVLIGIGSNKEKTHPRFFDYAEANKTTTHAEITLLLNLERNNMIQKVTDIIVFRGVNKPLNSFPCKLCFAHLVDEFTNVRLWFYKDRGWRHMEL